MKKKLISHINSLLVLVLTAISFSGCKQPAYGPSTPIINVEEATINGVHYDNETETCWIVTTKITYADDTITETGYYWNTEFGIIAQFEETMYTSVLAGNRASYQLSRASEFKDSESCLANNEKD